MPMWKEDNRALFAQCLDGLEQHPLVRQMQTISQHAKGVSCYDHCMFVAYLSFLMCRRMGLDYRAAARAGLLHDLYLQHWEDTSVGRLRRLVVHPHLALENAQVFGLSEKEADIIVKHMWPLTPALPRYAESYVVSTADKIAASVEMMHLVRPLGVGRNLAVLAAAEMMAVRI